MVSDEYAGRTGRCRSCQAPVTVGATSTGAPVGATAPPVRDLSQPTVDRLTATPTQQRAPLSAVSEDPRFRRDQFLLRQKHLSINEKYTVWDENGMPLFFVERPTHLLRNLLALFCGLLAGGVLFALLGFTYATLPAPIQSTYLLVGSLLAVVVIILVYVRLEHKRHVNFYADESKRNTVLRVMQDKKFEMLTATFTVIDGAGHKIGSFRKNFLYDIFRKQWECRAQGGSLLFIAREDSIVKSLLRRFCGPLLGLLRLNFIFLDPVSGENLGVFNRSFTILDRYVLDMSMDRRNRVDRRLALAMGVMLDTGERR